MAYEKRDRHQEWLCSLRKGDNKAFEKIYNEFWESLYAVAYNRLKCKEDIEGILQEIFTDMWRRRECLHIRTSLAAYLHAALKYKILNHIHAQSFRKTHGQDHPLYIQKIDNSTQEILSFEELYGSLQLGLEKLPEKCRLIFKMSREQQMSSKEIAEELNISHRTVQTHIHNAIKTLKVELVDYKSMIILFALNL